MSPPFSAVLLAGGQSSRMGRDKAFLEIDGVPLWSRQIGTLAALRPRAIFIAGPRHAAWINAGCEIVTDARANAGPLAALVASLRRCATPLLLALAVDLPEMPADYLRALLILCSTEQGLIPRRADHFEPLAAVYPLTALPLAERCLAAKDYSLQNFARRCLDQMLVKKITVTPTQESLFFNVNTPDDLACCRPGLPTGRAESVPPPDGREPHTTPGRETGPTTLISRAQ